MTLYLDTSALVKLYFDEAGATEVHDRVRKASVVSTSRIAYVETLAGIARKRREGGLRQKQVDRVLEAFGNDWDRIFVVELSEPVCREAGNLAGRHPLRALDAIHLASALLLRSRVGAVQFCCFDQRLSRAAAAEGFPPRTG